MVPWVDHRRPAHEDSVRGEEYLAERAGKNSVMPAGVARTGLILPLVLFSWFGGARAAIPVIVDTDIGTFADDTLALALALSSWELDVRMVITTSGNATFRARVAAKQLRQSGRDHIPVGIGVSLPQLHPREALEAFAADEDLSAHRGGWFADGPAAAARMIMSSGRKDWVIIVLGPSSSTAAMLKVEPAIAQRASVAVMGASVCAGVVWPSNVTTPRVRDAHPTKS
jgi:inosine-uridine nucleoside N-ribohydrolase